MGEQYSIPSQIFIFGSLQQLLEFVDRCIAENKVILKTYEDELGNLLRQPDQNEEWMKDLQSKMSNTKTDKPQEKPQEKAADQQNKGSEKKGKEDKSKKVKEAKKEDKKDKKGKGVDKKFSSQNWVNYRSVSIFNGNSKQGKADVYFNIINEIKTTIEKLSDVKEAVSPLSNLGFGQNVSYLTYVKNGIPERIVLYQGAVAMNTKFEFNAQFEGEELEAAPEAA